MVTEETPRVRMRQNRHDKNMMRYQAGECCWHCRHYIRPVGILMAGGPIGNLCTVDRETGTYMRPDVLNSGDTTTQPDEVCDRFEFELSPGITYQR